jgi:uncharacterized membrane protein (UPF0182 family)
MTFFDEFERRPPPSLSSLRWIIPLVGLVALWVLGSVGATIYTDWLWFDNLGYRSVYTTILGTRIGLFVLGALVFLAVFTINVVLAERFSPRGISPQAALNVPLEALLWARRLVIVGIIVGAVFLALVFGAAASSAWETVLRFVNSSSFGLTDPLFERDTSFYIFSLPFYRFLQGWLLGLVVVNGLVVLGIYAVNFALGGFQFAVTPTLRAHLSGLGAALFLLLAFGYWLGIQELLFSERGAAFGASYTDVNIRLPALWLLVALSIGVAFLMAANVYLQGATLPAAGVVIWFVVLALGTGVVPAIVQRFQVEPNEFALERPFIERTITMTREGFALNRIQEESYAADVPFTAEVAAQNPGTIENIRLWDHVPLKDVYNQIQFFRRYYAFQDIDVDRYTIGDEYRQVMVGARELNKNEVAATWVSQQLQFTHGYGVAMSPVTEFTPEGLPVFFIKDIPPQPVDGGPPVETPQIYFGENTNDWVIVRSDTPEFDHPTDTDPVYTAYQGEGVSISGLLRRLVFSWRFADVNILVTGEITSESQILYFRAVQERVRKLAPFLSLDSDPYIVVADGKLYWVQDGYTVSSRFPYSEPTSDGINYVRNSVKAVVDAYDGSVDFYLADASDGIIQTYASIFPALFKPLDQMPVSLRSHVRYPEDFFLVQSQKYLKFHMTDPQVFYNLEDLWSIPREVFFEEQSAPMEPYYLIMRLPNEPREEFVLIMPFTPANRPNLVGWLAARNDDPHYGRLVSYTFPKERQVDGPQQVEARINIDPLISEQFTLWSRAGSNVLRGNLLVIPVGGGILYAEPIYLQAEELQYPQLTRVVVAGQGQGPVMEPSLMRSLDVLLGRDQPTLPGEGPGPGEQPGDGTVQQRLQQELDRLRQTVDDLQRQLQDLTTTLQEALLGTPTPQQTPQATPTAP